MGQMSFVSSNQD